MISPVLGHWWTVQETMAPATQTRQLPEVLTAGGWPLHKFSLAGQVRWHLHWRLVPSFPTNFDNSGGNQAGTYFSSLLV